MRKIFLILAVFFCIFLIRSAEAAYNCGKTADAPEIKDVHVVLFILDGTPQKFLYGLVKDGTLPNLKEYFWDNGAHAEDAMTTFPSASTSAYQSYITGLLAGNAGVPYLKWFERDTETDVDYLTFEGYKRVNSDIFNLLSLRDPYSSEENFPVTLFEKLSGCSTTAVYSEITRGALERKPLVPLAAFANMLVLGRVERLDVNAFKNMKDLFNRKDPPRFVLTGLYATDVIQHKQTAGHEDAKYVLKQFDIFLGDFIGQLKQNGLFDKTYIIVVADHGMHNIQKTIDLAPILKKAGLRVKTRNPRQNGADVFVSERGVASAHLYFKANGTWEGRPTLKQLENYKNGVNVIDYLINNNDIEMLAVRGDDHKSYVIGKKGRGEITVIEVNGRPFYSYTVTGEDPFGYVGTKEAGHLMDGEFHSAEDWLYATHNFLRPDGVVSFSQIFDDGRAGDIFVVPVDSAGFMREKEATHGSLTREDMAVPILMEGPDIKKGSLGIIRTTDVYPMMLEWFGFPYNGNGDTKKEKSKDEELIANMEGFLLGQPPLYKVAVPDDLKRDFVKKFGNQASNAKIISMIDKEIKRRNDLVQKLKKKEQTDFIIREKKRAESSLDRMGDLKNLIQHRIGASEW